MHNLWTFDEFDTSDSERALCLRHAPSWLELLAAMLDALRTAVKTKTVRFGCEESGLDSRDFRGIVQFPIGALLFDQFFNSTTGYRAQFRIGSANGLTMNAQLIKEIAAELKHSATNDAVIHRYTSEFTYIESTLGKISSVTATLDPKLSKVWVCEKLISNSGQIENIFVSRTGPKLLMTDTDPLMTDTNSWSSLYAEDADGWLDIKGAFLSPTGQHYQLKSPEDRAEDLEKGGSA